MTGHTVLWVGREGGYFIYRIPCLLATPAGSVLALCEGRRHNRMDLSEVDLLMRRSVDAGRTWSPSCVVAGQPGTTTGNPCAVADRDTGVIWMLYCQNPAQTGNVVMKRELRAGRARRTVWVTHSADDGVTWSTPMEITEAVTRPGWNAYGTGPGHAIQLRSGRLVFPCYHGVTIKGDESDPHFSHVVYSDDHGNTWHRGGDLDQPTNECTAMERADGSLYLNARSEMTSDGRRVIAVSHDAGLSFEPTTVDESLVDPICHACVQRVADAPKQVLFSNPACTTDRENLTVRLSHDDGRTWPVARQLCAGRSAYSDLAVLPNDEVLCLFETDNDNGVASIMLARFNLYWLNEGVTKV